MNDPPLAPDAKLPDGEYDVMVVDVGPETGSSTDDSELCLVILKGPLKGTVVELRYPSRSGDRLDLLGEHGVLSASGEGLRLRLV
jgi:hypothetical protein